MKVLANHLLPFLPTLISLDHVELVPGREAEDNTIKSINILHRLKSQDTEEFFLSTDAEKVFSRVAWDYRRRP